MRLDQLPNRIQHNRPSNTHHLHLHFLDKLDLPHGANSRVRTTTREKLARTRCLEARLGVFPAVEDPRASCEDGLFARVQV